MNKRSVSISYRPHPLSRNLIYGPQAFRVLENLFNFGCIENKHTSLLRATQLKQLWKGPSRQNNVTDVRKSAKKIDEIEPRSKNLSVPKVPT